MTAAWLPTRALPRVRATAVDPFPAPDLLRALSVQAPWSWLLCAGYKPLENRKWRPNLRGEPRWLLVHAGAKEDRGVAEKIGAELDIDVPVVLSALVGAILVSGYENDSPSPWFVGPVAWTIDACVLFASPVTGVKGALALFRLPLAAEARVLDEWGRAEHRSWRYA